MECETCLVWYHNKCTGIEDDMYQVHIKHESYTWICYKCGIPNFTNSTLFLSQILSTSNSFDALSDIDPDLSNVTVNTGHFGSPKHASSPKKTQGPHGRNNLKPNSRSRPKLVQRSLKFLNINFQSIINKIPTFQVLLQKEKPDIIFGTETWLDSSVYSSEFLPSTYQIFRKDRNTTTVGGGVFLAVKNNLVAREESELSSKCESIWASILKCCEISIFSLRRLTRGNFLHFPPFLSHWREF